MNELAGLVGLASLDGITIGDLLARSRGRRLHDWTIAAHHMAAAINANRGPTDRRLTPEQLLPPDLRPRRRPRHDGRPGEPLTGDLVRAMARGFAARNGQRRAGP